MEKNIVLEEENAVNAPKTDSGYACALMDIIAASENTYLFKGLWSTLLTPHK